MVEYKCNTCGKIFKHKGTYLRHQNRKFPCSKLNHLESQMNHKKSDTCEQKNENESFLESQEKSLNKKVIHVCNWCNKEFSTNSNMNRHIKSYCKVKKSNEQEKELIYTQLLQQLEEQNEQNKKLINENKQLKNNSKQTINNTINNTTHNIKLVSFGDEDLNIIPEDIIKQALNYGFKSVPVFTKYLHFNKNKPENHNIYINNMKNKFVMVYKKDDWNLTNQDDILGKLIDFKTDFLADKFEEYKNDLPESTLRKFDRFLDEQYEDDVINDIKDELKLILYNNRKLPLKTKQELELIDDDLLVK